MSDLVERLRDKGLVISHVERDQIADEIERLQVERSAMIENVRFARERAERVEAERDAYRKDAERYRWLRDNKSTLTKFIGRGPLDNKFDADTIDVAIDAAIDNAMQDAKTSK